MRRPLLTIALFLALIPLAFAAAAADDIQFDEFGVPTGDTPPPMPKGYADEQAAMTDALTGAVPVIDIQGEMALPEGVTEQKDIQYGKGGDKPLLLNLYSPAKLDKPAPGLIFIHGGGWTSGHRKDYKYYTIRFAKRGYIVATISYRFSQDAPFPAAVQDAKCAVRWMRANAQKYNIDPNRIAAIGGSAGGYLAMMLGYSADVPELEGDGGWEGVSSKVQAVVNLYGPADIDCPSARDVDVVTKFLGKPYSEIQDQYELASPYRHITPDDPPPLILHGTIDTIVPVQQSDMLAEKLKAAGVPCVYEKFQGWPHTMDLALPVNIRCQWLMNKLFNQYLNGAK